MVRSENMTPEQVYKLLSEKFPTAETDWSGHESIPKPPYTVYITEAPDNIAADDRVYISQPRYIIELYMFKTDYNSEKILEELFDENCVFWEKDKNWNRELQLFQVIYKI